MEQNKCADLVEPSVYNEAEKLYNEMLFNNRDPLEEMLKAQFSLQEHVYKNLPERNFDPNKLEKLGDILEWCRDNFDALRDEERELIFALGGVSNGKDASSVWKKWKSKNVEYRDKLLINHTKDDKLELLFEVIDMWHFFMNLFIAFKLSAKDIFVLYYIKNKENFKRVNEKY